NQSQSSSSQASQPSNLANISLSGLHGNVLVPISNSVNLSSAQGSPSHQQTISLQLAPAPESGTVVLQSPSQVQTQTSAGNSPNNSPHKAVTLTIANNKAAANLGS